MQTYIIIFNSKNKSASMRKYIKSLGTWGRITDNAWVVSTSKTASQLRDDLLLKKEAGDTIFVVRSGAVAAWSSTPANNKWLKKYL